MKKLVFLFVLLNITLVNLFAQNYGVVDKSTLPKSSLDFLNKYFKDVNILYVEADWDELEVTLSNGVEIEFTRLGDWKSVDGKHQTIPVAFIPENVLKGLESAYPNIGIISIEKDWAGFEVELNNRMEVKIGADGKIYDMEYDD